MTKNSSLVYSTDSNKKRCPKCGQFECICRQEKSKPLENQTARISLDRKGRKGKSVTLIQGLSVNPQHLADIAKKLKQVIGSGGTAKQGRIELQGDHRKKVAEKLQEMGVKTKFVGG